MEIKSQKELRNVLNYEMKSWGGRSVTSFLGWVKEEFKFLIHPGNPRLFMYALRNVEFYRTKRKYKLLFLYYRYKLKQLQFKTGIDMFPGVAEIGVRVNHGKCVVSKSAKIGRDTIILSDVTIGGVGGMRDVLGAPVIGERVFIGSGSRIIGPVKIANDVVIGANSVVVKDITEPGITVAGCPAKKISNEGSEKYIRVIE